MRFSSVIDESVSYEYYLVKARANETRLAIEDRTADRLVRYDFLSLDRGLDRLGGRGNYLIAELDRLLKGSDTLLIF